jgi:hypothetical protein
MDHIIIIAHYEMGESEHTCSSNAQRTIHTLQFLLLYETRVRSVRGINATRLRPPAYVFAAKTVSYTSQFLYTQLTTQVLDDLLDFRVDFGRVGHLILNPFHDIEVGRRV